MLLRNRSIFSTANKLFFSSVAKPGNPFDSAVMAPYYYRPEEIYTRLLDRVASTINPHFRVNSALDVACGTGIFTQVLKSVSHRTVGVDASAHMLAHVKKDDRIEYKQATAEALPFEDGSFNLVTIVTAFQCVNQSLFMQEAARVLREDGHLIIAHTQFKGIDSPKFNDWFKNVFYEKYPLARGIRYYSPLQHPSEDFLFSFEQHYPEIIYLNNENFSKLLMTTSGVFSAVERYNENPKLIQNWLETELKPFFIDREVVKFKIAMSYWALKKIPTLKLLNKLYQR